MTKNEVASRLCALMDRVNAKLTNYTSAADCFCGQDSLGLVYRNDGEAVEFIERVVTEALEKHPDYAARTP